MLKYWKKRNQEFFEEARYSTWAFKGLIDKHFSNIKNKKVMDIGCGYGLILSHLESKGASAYGLEICKDIVKNRGKMKIIQGDCRDIPFKDNSFDYVMSFGVIEHLKDWDKAISEHFRICKPGGKVLISVPYIYSPLYYVTVLYYLPRIIKYNLLVSLGKGFGKRELKKEMSKYAEVEKIKAFDFCSLLEGLTKKKYFNLAKILEKYFAFMGLMLYCIAEKRK